MPMRKILLLTAVASFAAIPGMTKDMPESSVPANVVSSVKSTYAEAGSIEWEFKRSRQIYEAEFRVKGYDYKVHLTQDGKIVYVCRDIDVSAVPEVVKNAALKEVPQGRIREAEEITEGNAVRYKVEIADNRDDYDLTIAADGKIIRRDN